MKLERNELRSPLDFSSLVEVHHHHHHHLSLSLSLSPAIPFPTVARCCNSLSAPLYFRLVAFPLDSE